MRVGLSPRIVLAAGILLAAPAFAQDGAPLSLELNNARDSNGACRLSYVALNGTTDEISKLSYQVVVFDKGGQVAQFLVLDFGALAAGKTKVVEFNLPARPCSEISRILINESAECTVAGAASKVCMDRLKPGTKTPIAFGV